MVAANHGIHKLGKKLPKNDYRTLCFADYIDHANLPAPRPAWRWGSKVTSWPMLRNDAIGDCTIAGALHMVQLWNSDTGKFYTPTDQEAMDGYIAVTGAEGATFDPATGDNDNGCAMLDVCNYWRKHGLGGHKIAGYTQIEPGNTSHLMLASYLFGGVYIGMALPNSCKTQSVWSVPTGGPRGPGAPGSWGGHAIPVVWYDHYGLCVVTWGQLLWMTWGFFQTYCDEAYAVLSQDWLNNQGVAPSNYNFSALEADLALVAA